MERHLHNRRFWVLVSTVLLSSGIYLWITTHYSPGTPQIGKLTQTYALLALLYLYLSLLIGPLCFTVHFLPFRGALTTARRAIGVSAFYFGLLHAYFAFFRQLKGFEGLKFLGPNYLVSVITGFVVLLILGALAITSTDWMVARLTYPRWKLLHRLIYLAGFLTLFHALQLGSHFLVLTGAIPQIAFVLLCLLLLLEGLRIDAILTQHFPTILRLGMGSGGMLVLLTIVGITTIFPTSALPLSLHSSTHTPSSEAETINHTNLPPHILKAMSGDTSKRFLVRAAPNAVLTANSPHSLHLEVFNASNGKKETAFLPLYGEHAHLIVVDETFSSFTRLTPTLTPENTFEVSAVFPQDGTYLLFFSFQPKGAIEQQFVLEMPVGNNTPQQIQPATQDKTTRKTIGNYAFALVTPDKFTATDLESGKQTLAVTVSRIDTNEEITTLAPYLGAFGHATLVHTQTHEFLHGHPIDIPSDQKQTGGPTVFFQVMNMFGRIKPGTYRLFVETNPDETVTVVDFVIEIQ